MSTGILIQHRGPKQVEQHRFEFDDGRQPEFSEDTVYYDESAAHWVVTLDELPERELPGWARPGTPVRTPFEISIPREKVLRVNRWKPYEKGPLPSHDPQSNDVSAEIAYGIAEWGLYDDSSPSILNDKTVEFLEKPVYDSKIGHWRLRFHAFDARDGEGRTEEVTQLVPRERIIYAYTSGFDGEKVE